MTREKALETLRQRRPYAKGSGEYQYRTVVAWKYLQFAMHKPVMSHTDTPPPVTVGASQ